jgi:hypothetical protein
MNDFNENSGVKNFASSIGLSPSRKMNQTDAGFEGIGREGTMSHTKYVPESKISGTPENNDEQKAYNFAKNIKFGENDPR